MPIDDDFTFTVWRYVNSIFTIYGKICINKNERLLHSLPLFCFIFDYWFWFYEKRLLLCRISKYISMFRPYFVALFILHKNRDIFVFCIKKYAA